MVTTTSPLQSTAWDRLGIGISTACAIHCAVLPLLAGFLPLVAFRHLISPWVEWPILFVAVAVGLVAHIAAYRNHHRHLGPGLLFVIGATLVFIVRWTHPEGLMETTVMVSAGVMMATAHVANIWLCRGCRGCHHHDETADCRFDELCIRVDDHEPPCNGLPRPTCPGYENWVREQ
jgi:hypothetical protein